MLQKNPALLLRQPISLDATEQFYHSCLSLIQRRILIEQNQSKKKFFWKIHCSQGLILIVT